MAPNAPIATDGPSKWTPPRAATDPKIARYESVAPSDMTDKVLLGHSSIAVTGDVYGHTSDDTARSALDGPAARFGP
jgi:hypothetical protein